MSVAPWEMYRGTKKEIKTMFEIKLECEAFWINKLDLR